MVSAGINIRTLRDGLIVSSYFKVKVKQKRDPVKLSRDTKYPILRKIPGREMKIIIQVMGFKFN